jgi:hypothetical protein
MSEPFSVFDPASTDAAKQPVGLGWFGWGDWAGMVASIGCAIHCAAMPFVIAYLPALGLSFLADETFHQWMAVVCFVIALTAFIPGLRRHGRWTPVLIGSVGLLMISVPAFGFVGDCCVSCEIGDTNVADLAIPVSFDSPQTETADAAGTCTEACCVHCTENASETQQSDSTVSPTTASLQTQMSWIEPIAPWLTPIGGLVLVSAHLLNRRFGCLCGCCETEFTGVQP